MLGAVARAGSSLLAGKSVEKLGNESLKVISLYNGSSKYDVALKIPQNNFILLMCHPPIARS